MGRTFGAAFAPSQNMVTAVRPLSTPSASANRWSPAPDFEAVRAGQAELRQGHEGDAVKRLQLAINQSGLNPPLDVDGRYGNDTARGVRALQEGLNRQGAGLTATGAFDFPTIGALGRAGKVDLAPQVGAPGAGTPTGTQYSARGTGYYPDNSAMEGGYFDRKGKPLNTLQAYLRGDAPFVSVAMDSKAFPYGTKLRIPELEAKYGRPIEFRVVDTGGAFKGRGTSRIDICTENRRASLDPTINGPLTLQTVR